jgi:hypothetical protein
MELLKLMADQLPGSDGLSDLQRRQQLEARNAEVLRV